LRTPHRTGLRRRSTARLSSTSSGAGEQPVYLKTHEAKRLSRRYWAAAYYNGDFFCIQTHSGYRMTVADPKGKLSFLPPDTTDQYLGEAILDCLAHSRFVHPEEQPLEDAELFDMGRVAMEYSAWVDNLKKAYGYRTKRALFKVMDHCSIDRDKSTITFRPSYHSKLEAWSGDGIRNEDEVVIPAASSAAEVGAALRLAFSRCLPRFVRRAPRNQ
jgi:hypothetical protein